MRIATFVVALFLLVAHPGPLAAAPTRAAGQVWITKAQYGKRWPFKVRAGLLACTQGSAVTFRARGVTYAVNGTAKMYGYANINKIWRFDPAYPGLGLRVNIGPIINRGLKLC